MPCSSCLDPKLCRQKWEEYVNFILLELFGPEGDVKPEDDAELKALKPPRGFKSKGKHLKSKLSRAVSILKGRKATQRESSEEDDSVDLDESGQRALHAMFSNAGVAAESSAVSLPGDDHAISPVVSQESINAFGVHGAASSEQLDERYGMEEETFKTVEGEFYYTVGPTSGSGLVGRHISRQKGTQGGTILGKILAFHADDNMYAVRFQDGHEKDVSEEEVFATLVDATPKVGAAEALGMEVSGALADDTQVWFTGLDNWVPWGSVRDTVMQGVREPLYTVGEWLYVWHGGCWHFATCTAYTPSGHGETARQRLMASVMKQIVGNMKPAGPTSFYAYCRGDRMSLSDFRRFIENQGPLVLNGESRALAPHEIDDLIRWTKATHKASTITYADFDGFASAAGNDAQPRRSAWRVAFTLADFSHGITDGEFFLDDHASFDKVRPGPKFRVGDRVDVRDKNGAQWFEGTVTLYTPPGQPDPWRVEFRHDEGGARQSVLLDDAPDTVRRVHYRRGDRIKVEFTGTAEQRAAFSKQIKGKQTPQAVLTAQIREVDAEITVAQKTRRPASELESLLWQRDELVDEYQETVGEPFHPGDWYPATVTSYSARSDAEPWRVAFHYDGGGAGAMMLDDDFNRVRVLQRSTGDSNRKVLPPLNVGALFQRFLRVIFDKMDANRDGSVSRQEAIAAAKADPVLRTLLGIPRKLDPQGEMTTDQREQFEAMFADLDEDGSGDISMAELVNFMKRKLGSVPGLVSEEEHERNKEEAKAAAEAAALAHDQASQRALGQLCSVLSAKKFGQKLAKSIAKFTRLPQRPVRAADFAPCHLPIPSKEKREELFTRWARQSGNLLTLSDANHAVEELWPHWLPRQPWKPPLARAYRAADAGRCGWIGRREFRMLLLYTAYLNGEWTKLDECQNAAHAMLADQAGDDAQAEAAVHRQKSDMAKLDEDRFVLVCCMLKVIRGHHQDPLCRIEGKKLFAEVKEQCQPLKPVSHHGAALTAGLEPGRFERSLKNYQQFHQISFGDFCSWLVKRNVNTHEANGPRATAGLLERIIARCTDDTQLKRDLSGGSLEALAAKAAELGIDKRQIRAEGEKEYIIALIVEKAPASVRSELSIMSVSALKNRADELGIEKERLQEAGERQYITALIVEKTQAAACEETVRLGAFGPVVPLLSARGHSAAADTELQLLASKVLYFLCKDHPERQAAVIEQGALTPLTKIVRGAPNEPAVWAAGVMAWLCCHPRVELVGGSVEAKDVCKGLLHAVSKGGPAVLEHATHALAGVVRTNASNRHRLVEHGVVELLVNVLSEGTHKLAAAREKAVAKLEARSRLEHTPEPWQEACDTYYLLFEEDREMNPIGGHRFKGTATTGPFISGAPQASLSKHERDQLATHARRLVELEERLQGMTMENMHGLDAGAKRWAADALATLVLEAGSNEEIREMARRVCAARALEPLLLLVHHGREERRTAGLRALAAIAPVCEHLSPSQELEVTQMLTGVAESFDPGVPRCWAVAALFNLRSSESDGTALRLPPAATAREVAAALCSEVEKVDQSHEARDRVAVAALGLALLCRGDAELSQALVREPDGLAPDPLAGLQENSAEEGMQSTSEESMQSFGRPASSMTTSEGEEMPEPVITTKRGVLALAELLSTSRRAGTAGSAGRRMSNASTSTIDSSSSLSSTATGAVASSYGSDSLESDSSVSAAACRALAVCASHSVSLRREMGELNKLDLLPRLIKIAEKAERATEAERESKRAEARPHVDGSRGPGSPAVEPSASLAALLLWSVNALAALATDCLDNQLALVTGKGAAGNDVPTIVAVLVRVLASANADAFPAPPLLLQQAASALAALAQHVDATKAAVLSEGGGPSLVFLLGAPHAETRAAAAQTIASVAHNSTANKQIFIRHRVVPGLVKCVQGPRSDGEAVKLAAGAALQCLAANNPAGLRSIVRDGGKVALHAAQRLSQAAKPPPKPRPQQRDRPARSKHFGPGGVPAVTEGPPRKARAVARSTKRPWGVRPPKIAETKIGWKTQLAGGPKLNASGRLSADGVAAPMLPGRKGLVRGELRGRRRRWLAEQAPAIPTALFRGNY